MSRSGRADNRQRRPSITTTDLVNALPPTLREIPWDTRWRWQAVGQQVRRGLETYLGDREWSAALALRF